MREAGRLYSEAYTSLDPLDDEGFERTTKEFLKALEDLHWLVEPIGRLRTPGRQKKDKP